MATADLLNTLISDISDAYDAINTKGGTVPQNKNTSGLATAIASIQSGGISKLPQVVDRSVTSITAEDLGNITTIGSSVFSGCSNLTSVTIPNSVTSIGASSFVSCISLASITIPDGVTSIGNSAFYRCLSLTSVTINATTPPILGNVTAFTETNNCPIYVPSGSVTAYQTATNWSNFASRIQAIPS